MTREEALQILDTIPTIGEQVDALEMAIQALSQEPCDDAISRKKAIWVISACDGKSSQIEALEQLPSVTQKSGKWIDYSDEGYVECPFCGHATNCEDDIDELHYCFYCGARMESEDKK